MSKLGLFLEIKDYTTETIGHERVWTAIAQVQVTMKTKLLIYNHILY